jgi:hypothetical protein
MTIATFAHVGSKMVRAYCAVPPRRNSEGTILWSTVDDSLCVTSG